METTCIPPASGAKATTLLFDKPLLASPGQWMDHPFAIIPFAISPLFKSPFKVIALANSALCVTEFAVSTLTKESCASTS